MPLESMVCCNCCIHVYYNKFIRDAVIASYYEMYARINKLETYIFDDDNNNNNMLNGQ